jgi:hypothetical protein
MPTYKITSKQFCTPQEKINYSSGSRWILDSDCGEKLSGVETNDCEAPSYTAGLSVTDTAAEVVPITSGIYRVFIKNVGRVDLLISVDDNSSYLIKLEPDQVFSANVFDEVWVKTASSTTTINVLYAKRIG